MQAAWCDGHEVIATRELWWIESPGSRDERGRATAVCDDDQCLMRVREAVEQLGDFQQVISIH